MKANSETWNDSIEWEKSPWKIGKVENFFVWKGMRKKFPHLFSVIPCLDVEIERKMNGFNTDSWEWGSKRTWKSDVRSSIGFASFPPTSMLCSVRLTNKVLSRESFLRLLLFAGSVWQNPRGFEDPRRSHYSNRLVATQNITVLFCIINFDFNKSTDLKISRGRVVFWDIRLFKFLNLYHHKIYPIAKRFFKKN